MNLGLGSLNDDVSKKETAFTGMSPQALETIKQVGTPGMKSPVDFASTARTMPRGVTPSLLDALVAEKILKKYKAAERDMILKTRSDARSVKDKNMEEVFSKTLLETTEEIAKTNRAQKAKADKRLLNLLDPEVRSKGIAKAPIKKPMKMSAQGGIVGYASGGSLSEEEIENIKRLESPTGAGASLFKFSDFARTAPAPKEFQLLERKLPIGVAAAPVATTATTPVVTPVATPVATPATTPRSVIDEFNLRPFIEYNPVTEAARAFSAPIGPGNVGRAAQAYRDSILAKRLDVADRALKEDDLEVRKDEVVLSNELKNLQINSLNYDKINQRKFQVDETLQALYQSVLTTTAEGQNLSRLQKERDEQVARGREPSTKLLKRLQKAQERFNEKFNEAAGKGREFNLIAESKALGTARKKIEGELGLNMFDPNMGVKKLD